eukprot:COSAG01_NODE_714_length_14097_cov_6.044435_6_plen_67_part_00
MCQFRVGEAALAAKKSQPERQRAQAAQDRQTAQGEEGRGKLRRGYGADMRRRIRLSARTAPAEVRQ